LPIPEIPAAAVILFAAFITVMTIAVPHPRPVAQKRRKRKIAEESKEDSDQKISASHDLMFKSY
jgi:hypothetical protein